VIPTNFCSALGAYIVVLLTHAGPTVAAERDAGGAGALAVMALLDPRPSFLHMVARPRYS
jgi:hypothetical protein